MQTIATVPNMLAVALPCNALIVAGELSPSQREPAKHYRFIYNRDGCSRFWWVPSAGEALLAQSRPRGLQSFTQAVRSFELGNL